MAGVTGVTGVVGSEGASEGVSVPLASGVVVVSIAPVKIDTAPRFRFGAATTAPAAAAGGGASPSAAANAAAAAAAAPFLSSCLRRFPACILAMRALSRPPVEAVDGFRFGLSIDATDPAPVVAFALDRFPFGLLTRGPAGGESTSIADGAAVVIGSCLTVEAVGLTGSSYILAFIATVIAAALSPDRIGSELKAASDDAELSAIMDCVCGGKRCNRFELESIAIGEDESSPSPSAPIAAANSLESR